MESMENNETLTIWIIAVQILLQCLSELYLHPPLLSLTIVLMSIIHAGLTRNARRAFLLFISVSKVTYHLSSPQYTMFKIIEELSTAYNKEIILCISDYNQMVKFCCAIAGYSSGHNNQKAYRISAYIISLVFIRACFVSRILSTYECCMQHIQT